MSNDNILDLLKIERRYQATSGNKEKAEEVERIIKLVEEEVSNEQVS